MPPENPNDYDESRYQQAVEQLDAAVRVMWEAGAGSDNIVGEAEHTVSTLRKP